MAQTRLISRRNDVIRDIRGVGTHSIYEGCFNSPHIRGALGGTVGSDFPPKLPLCGVGGHIEGTVGASLTLYDASSGSSGGDTHMREGAMR